MPSDLFMEHLNRQLKGVIRNMGSNVQPPSLVRAAKAIGVVHNVCTVVEEETRLGRKSASDRHSRPSSTKDVKLIVNQLVEADACAHSLTCRKHSTFKFKHCLLSSNDSEQLCTWIVENIMPSIIFK